jgi:nuclear protein localization family protein 4
VEHHVSLTGRPLTRRPQGVDPVPGDLTVNDAGLENGAMLYLAVDETEMGVHENAVKTTRLITKEGNIVAQDYHSTSAVAGFRPGMLPLRSMKMHWTLNEFTALNDQFEYKVKRQEEAFCKKVSLDTASLTDFQQYMWSFDYRKMRIGYLYGYFTEDNNAKVEFIYEPPQECTDTTFQLLEDPHGDHVEMIAHVLQMRRVGWVVAHPPREKGFHLSATELITAAELQLEAANGVEETPFVTVKVTLDEKNDVFAEGFQVSLQCMDMVAESVLQVAADPGLCSINPTFTAIVEGRGVKEVDCSFFLTLVPIEQHESKLLISTFPPANRDGVMRGQTDMKKQFARLNKSGWRFIDLISDFQFLLYLCDLLDVNHDIPAICNTILNKGEIPLDDGYLLIIRSLAGLDD